MCLFLISGLRHSAGPPPWGAGGDDEGYAYFMPFFTAPIQAGFSFEIFL